MGITVKLLDARKSASEWKLKIQYTEDGVSQVFDRRMNGITDQDLIKYLRNGAKVLEERKGSDYTKHIGKEIDITPDPVIVPPPPTPEEVAKEQWIKDWYKLDRMVHLVDNGIIPENDPRIIAQRTKVIDGWDDSYLGDI